MKLKDLPALILNSPKNKITGNIRIDEMDMDTPIEVVNQTNRFAEFPQTRNS